MTDQKPCPRCGCTVSDSTSYYFIAAENLRWHYLCYHAAHPEPVEDKQKEGIR